MGQKYVYLPELFKLSKEEKLIIWVSEWGLASLEAELWKPITMGCAFKESRGGLAVWFSCTIQEPRPAPAFSVEERWVKARSKCAYGHTQWYNFLLVFLDILHPNFFHFLESLLSIGFKGSNSFSRKGSHLGR